MAIGASNLTNGTSGADDTTIITASITPTADRLILLSVLTSISSAAPNTPTASGNGLTWVQVASVPFNTIATPRSRLTLFRAMGASPSAGAVTVNFGGQTQHSRTWSVEEFSGVDTSGTNGSGALAASASTSADALSNPTAFGPTLGAFGSADNRTFAVAASDSGGVISLAPGESATQLSENVVTGGSLHAINVQWQPASADTTPTWTGASGPQDYAAIGVEVEAVVTDIVYALNQVTETGAALVPSIHEVHDLSMVEELPESLTMALVTSGAVLDLGATAVSATEIVLDWQPFPGATGYDVERNGVVVAEFLSDSPTYLDTGLTPDTTYTYRVRAVI